MIFCNCNFRCTCTLGAIIASIITGVAAAFLQFAGVFTVTTAFLWVAFGIAVGYLAILAATAGPRSNPCVCRNISTVLIGILGAVLLSLILLAVGIVATSAVSAILVGLLLFFAALTVTGTACYVRCAADCTE